MARPMIGANSIFWLKFVDEAQADRSGVVTMVCAAGRGASCGGEMSSGAGRA